jgi:hypothetical protein
MGRGAADKGPFEYARPSHRCPSHQNLRKMTRDSIRGKHRTRPKRAMPWLIVSSPVDVR